MPPKKNQGQQPGQQFSFVTYEHPSNAKDPGLRREIRSHVTSHQHRLTREKRHAAREEAFRELERRNQGIGRSILPNLAPTTAPGEELFKEPVAEVPAIVEAPEAGSQHKFRHQFENFSSKKAGKQRAESSSPNRDATAAGRKTQRQISPVGELARSVRAKYPKTEREEECIDPVLLENAPEASSRRSSPKPRRNSETEDGVFAEGLSDQFLVSSKASRVALLGDPTDSIAKVLASLRLNFSSVMEHYQWIVGAQSPDFERQFMPDRPPRYGFKTMITGVPSDPAFVAVAALISAGHILSIRNSPMSQMVAQGIGNLRSLVLKTINTALQDPKRACTDPLLCAVLILATHEGLQGSRQSYDVHMKGLVQMINMRGGLDCVNNVQPFTSTLIAWQDTNVSTILGCPPYHKMAKKSENAPVVKPNPMMWLLREV